MTATIYVAATTTPPTIVCPPWCDIETAEHLGELGDWEGRCVHRAFRVPEDCDQFDLTAGQTLCADGAIDTNRPDDQEVMLTIEGKEYTFEQARTIGLAILALVDELTAPAVRS